MAGSQNSPSEQTLRGMTKEIAGLDLTEEEIAALTSQLDALLSDMRALDELDMSEVEPVLRFVCDKRTDDDDH